MPAPTDRASPMSERLVTLATFDTSAEAHIALNALTAAGIWADLNGEALVGNFWSLSTAVSGIQLVVRGSDTERALEIIGPMASVGTGEREVSDEELERQALAAVPEEGQAETDLMSPEPPTATPSESDAGQTIDRNKYAWRAFWLAWFAFACWPLAFLALYMLLRAAFGSGELTRFGRIHLTVATIVVCCALLLAYVLMNAFMVPFRP